MAENITSRIVRSVDGPWCCATCKGLIVVGDSCVVNEPTLSVWHNACFPGPTLTLRPGTPTHARVERALATMAKAPAEGKPLAWPCPCCGGVTSCAPAPPPRMSAWADAVTKAPVAPDDTLPPWPAKPTPPPTGWKRESLVGGGYRLDPSLARWGEAPYLDRSAGPWRPGTWRPLPGIAIADAQRGRPDHRGAQRPCDVCGLRACWHLRDKAGW